MNYRILEYHNDCPDTAFIEILKEGKEKSGYYYTSELCRWYGLTQFTLWDAYKCDNDVFIRRITDL